ncbi:MAG TPA: MmcQ/YjbR family DNA-binding protein [Nitrospirota bacterium]
MLNAKDFQRIALGMKDAMESAHMGHPDFRVNGRIFATLHSDLHSGMVKLTPDQQQTFVRENPAAFMPEAGAWGRQGCTQVRLDSVDEDTLGEAITLAWQNTARKRGTGRSKPKRTMRSTRPLRKR